MKTITLLTFMLSLMICNAAHSAERYFVRLNRYTSPPTPVKEMSKEEAEKRGSYILAVYDDKKRVSTLTSIGEQKPAYSHEYTYNDKGEVCRIKNIVYGEKGRITITKIFDDKSIRTEIYDINEKLLSIRQRDAKGKETEILIDQ